LFVPVWVVTLFYLHKDRIIFSSRKIKKQIYYYILAILVFAVPFVYMSFFTPAIRERAASTSILRDVSLTQNLNNGNYSSFTEKIFNNDAYLVFRHWMGKYLNYYDLRFWFWKGMQFTPEGYPDLGLLYVVNFPIFILGVFALAKSKNKLLRGLVLIWFFLGPLPASLTMNEQHPLRSLTWLPFFGIVVASGFEYIGKNFKKWKKLILVFYSTGFVLNIVYFTDIYLHHFPFFYSEYWQYGYKDAALYACENRDNYDHIFISDTFGSKGPLNTGLPDKYYLFYCEIDPVEYVRTRKLDKIGFRRPSIEFAEQTSSNNLYIAAPWDFPLEDILEEQIVKSTQYPSGETAFMYVKTKKN
jgi:hypothetical protein